MKTKIFSLAFLALTSVSILLSGCKEVEIPINFSYKGAQAVFNVLPTNETTTSSTAIIKFNVDSLAKQYKFNKSDLKYIKMKALKITIVDTNPSPYTFDLIESLDGYAVASGKANSKIFTQQNIEVNSATQLTIPILDQDIKDFLTSNQLEIKLDASLRDKIEHTFKLVGDLEYTIDAIGFEKK